MWANVEINVDDVMVGYIQQDPLKAVKNVKDVLMAYKYHQQPDICNMLAKSQVKRESVTCWSRWRGIIPTEKGHLVTNPHKSMEF